MREKIIKMSKTKFEREMEYCNLGGGNRKRRKGPYTHAKPHRYIYFIQREKVINLVN